ncbi:MAG: hypothetical protein U1E25_12595 [Methylocystis sp.]
MAKSPKGGERPRQFGNREDLEGWLSAQKPDVALAIAARTALRVVPLAERAFPKSEDALSVRRFLDLMGAIFRATALARVAAVYTARANELRTTSAATAAYAAAADAVAVAAAAPAAFAADAAAYAADAAAADAAAAAAADAVSADADAAATAAVSADAAATGADIWTVVWLDAAFVLNGGSSGALASQRLWPDGAPSWAEDAWKKLRSDFPAENDWQVWTN